MPKRKTDVERVVLRPEEMIPVDWNPNEMTPEEYELLKETIAKNGFLDPPTVRKTKDGTIEITHGHHRWMAAKDLGLEFIPCDMLVDKRWQDEDEVKLQAIAFNQIHGKLNPEKFVPLFQEMAKKRGDDVHRNMGFTRRDGVQKMIKQVSKEMKASLPPEAAEQFEQQAKEARTVSDLERIIQNLFQEHGETISHSYMIFSLGGKQHIYIATTKQTHGAMKKILKHAKAANLDVNEVIGEAIEKIAADLKKPKAKAKKEEQAEQLGA